MSLIQKVVRRSLPLPLRKLIKWVYYGVLDISKPIKTPRVPARRDIFVGGGDFAAVGEKFFGSLKEHGLKPDMKVLDVGCGQGRIARPLVDYLVEPGRYDGMDIVASGIRWCQKNYADVPHFTFHHANILNKTYNPNGDTLASEFRFPFDDDTFDFVFLSSVFTHMHTADVRQYLTEITRVTKPGGVHLITWFITNQTTESAMEPLQDFLYELDEVSKTTVRSNPEEAIAFDEGFVMSLYEEVGLTVETFEPGRWSGLTQSRFVQDFIRSRNP